MRGLFALAALAGLFGCASIAPLDEAERARIRVVAPAVARFPPKLDFKVPPGKGEGAVLGGTEMAIRAGQICVFFIYTGPGFAGCLAAFGGTGAAIGAAVTPSSEGIAAQVERVRSPLGAPDVQQLLMQRFSERVTRLTQHTIDLTASKHGPQSLTDAPTYSGTVAGEDTLVAELAVLWVGATLVEPTEFFGTDYASRPLHIGLNARMRLVRPSDGATLMTRYYAVARYGRRLQEYQEDGARLLKAVAGAVDEIATLMVDDAFLLRSDAAGTGGATAPAITALEPLPSGWCLAPPYDCWAFNRVPKLDTVSPRFRWQPFPEPGHFETAPWLRAARNIVYDLWILGGDDDRVVEGLTSTDHTLERPLPYCMRYSWAVRARFDTDRGPRTVEWSTTSGFSRMQIQSEVQRQTMLESPMWPLFGMPFITPCPAKAGGPSAGRQ